MLSEELEKSMKIFIGGLSFDTTDETLRNYFAKYGDIADSVVICESGSRKPRGFGFVTYKDVTSVKNCLAGIPHQIDGKTVEVKHAVPRESNELAAPHERRSKKIFIGGLGASTTETEIRQYFNQFGKILNIDLKKDRDTNVLRGFGFVVFEAEDSVDKVLTARYHDVGGRKVEVKKAEPRSALSTSNNNGIGRFPRMDTNDTYPSDGYFKWDGRVREKISGYLDRHGPLIANAQSDNNLSFVNGYDDHRFSPNHIDSDELLHKGGAIYRRQPERPSRVDCDVPYNSDLVFDANFSNYPVNSIQYDQVRDLYDLDANNYNVNPLPRDYHHSLPLYSKQPSGRPDGNHNNVIARQAGGYQRHLSRLHYDFDRMPEHDGKEAMVGKISSERLPYDFQPNLSRRHNSNRRQSRLDHPQASGATYKGIRRAYPY